MSAVGIAAASARLHFCNTAIVCIAAGRRTDFFGRLEAVVTGICRNLSRQPAPVIGAAPRVDVIVWS